MAIITNDMRRFILMNIPSIPYLEAMLLLRGDSEAQWSTEQVAKRLFVNEKIAEEILKKLLEAGIIQIVNPDIPLYQYFPQSEDFKKMIDELAQIYTTDLIEVTNLIHSNINKRAQKFANAFIWRKDS